MIILAEAVKDPAAMTAGEINRELDQLDKKNGELVDALIAAGRGHERYDDTARQGDPLSKRYVACSDRMVALHSEIETRMGPGAPRRIPAGRGFGPRSRP
jgi:hypothetical protein